MTKDRDLQGWLKSNVISYPEPKLISLSEFEVDWVELKGDFVLALDSVRIEPKIRFSLDSNGLMKYWVPMHHSPVGVPASYPAFELTDATQDAINRVLEGIFGRFRALGLNKDIGRLITSDTPILERVFENNSLELIRKRLGAQKFSAILPNTT